MKLAHEMKLLAPVKERADISPVPYTDEYREKYKRMYNACYREIREALDIKPYDFIQDDSFFDEGMDKVYLLLDRDEIIGSVALKGGEIDDLLVAPDYQGLGFGGKILLWAIAHMTAEPVVLHVADWNKKAIRLYQKYGFRITETFEIGG